MPAATAVRIAREVTADLLASVADLFARVETRRHATAVVTGLQTRMETKNCWSLAQNAGHADPWRLQHFFNDAKWDEDALRERGAAAAWERLAHRSERVLVFDETGGAPRGADESCKRRCLPLAIAVAS